MDIILYNPLSRNGKSKETVLDLQKYLLNLGNQVQVHNIFEIVSVKDFLTAVSKEDRIIIVGGDGTLHHLVNSIRDIDVNQPIYVLKAGTGNDFIRSLKSKEHLIEITPYIKDLPKVTFSGKESLFLNGTGMGVDAMVCHYVNTSTKKKTAINYFKTALKCFLTFKPRKAVITIDGVEKTYNKVWFALAANSCYMGGGMKFSPKSKREDDILEMMIIHRIPRILLFLIFPTIYLGWHVMFKRYVKIIPCKEVKVSYESNTFLQMDGESVADINYMEIKR